MKKRYLSVLILIIAIFVSCNQNAAMFPLPPTKPGTIATYTVTFHANGGSFSTGESVKHQVLKDTLINSIDVEVPVLEGQNFIGWSTEKTGENLIAEDAKVSEDVNLYAVWEGQKISVTFDFNYEGAESPRTIEVAYNASLSSVIEAPEREGYTFDGWYTASTDGEKVESITAAQTVYAHWSVVQFDVTFEAGEGKFDDSNSSITKKVDYKNTVTAPDAPSRDGYLFNGWLYDGNPYDMNTLITEAITLTADWVMDPFEQYSFIGDGKLAGTLSSSQTGIAYNSYQNVSVAEGVFAAKIKLSDPSDAPKIQIFVGRHIKGAIDWSKSETFTNIAEATTSEQIIFAQTKAVENVYKTEFKVQADGLSGTVEVTDAAFAPFDKTAVSYLPYGEFDYVCDVDSTWQKTDPNTWTSSTQLNNELQDGCVALENGESLLSVTNWQANNTIPMPATEGSLDVAAYCSDGNGTINIAVAQEGDDEKTYFSQNFNLTASRQTIRCSFDHTDGWENLKVEIKNVGTGTIYIDNVNLYIAEE